MRKALLSFLLAFTSALAIGQLNMTLLDQIDYTPNTNDIWGWVDPDNGKEYALVGLTTGLSIVDVSNPSNIQEVQFIPGASSSWRDIKTWGNYAYVTNENSGGVLVVDLSGAPNNITWTSWSPNIPGLGTLTKCHNLYIDEFGYCYLAGCNINSGGILIANVFTTPGSPVYVGKGPAVYAHDVYARNNRMYGSEIYQGNMAIYDVADKQNVVLLAQQPTPSLFTHNVWLSDDGNVAFTTDEKANAPVAAYDISDVDNIVELDQFKPLSTIGTNVIPHNVHVWNDWLIISYYTSGGIIVDASRPENLIEVGNFDTFFGANSGYNGVWGAYPFLPSGNVLLTDIGNGLFVCGTTYVRACWLEGKVSNALTGAAIAGANVSIASPQANAGVTNLTGSYQTGQAIPGTFDVTFSATGYFPKTVPATLENGVLTLLDVALEPLVIATFPPFTHTAPTSGCATLTIDFFETSGLAASWLWTFENGNPATSTEQNPSVSFSVPGTHSVSLQVVTQGGNTYNQEATGLVVIAPSPSAAFSSSVDSVTVSFTNNSTNFNNLVWDFGDGNSSNAINPQHEYHQAGTYSVTLTTYGDCGVDVAEQTVTIGPFVPQAKFFVNTVAGCAPVTVNFTDLSSNGPTNWFWSFPGGTPSTSTEQNPTVTYASGGNFDVQLTVSNAAGSSQSMEAGLISISEVPLTGFNTSVNGPEVQFFHTSVGAGGTFLWDFGNGQTSNVQNPLHTYIEAGPYNVNLTVTNACGTFTFLQDLLVDVFLPIPVFIQDVTTGCAPLTISYSDLSTGQPTSWIWSFLGTSNDTIFDQNPIIVYDTAGIYGVTLIVENSWGSAAVVVEDLISINTTPSVDFGFDINANEVSFTNNSNNATTCTWHFNDGSGSVSSESNPTHTFPGVGTYPVTLYCTNDCGTVSTSLDVTIAAVPPTAAFSLNQTQGCAPFEVQFTDQSADGPTAWAWSFPGGTPATSTEQNPTVTYAVAGIYSATLAASNSAGTSETTQTDIVTVTAPPVAAYSFVLNDVSANFTNSSENALSYVWDFGDGNTSTQQSPQHSFASNGTYTVVLTATNGCGSTSVEQEVVIDVDAPVALFSPTQAQGCAPVTFTFTDESIGIVTDWAWSFPGGNPSTATVQNPTVTYVNPGVYNVELTASGPGGSDESITNLVVVDIAPQANFSFTTNGMVVNFANLTIFATSYAWDFGDGLGTSTEANPVYTYGAPGVYMATLVASNTCGTSTYTQTVTIVIGSVNDNDQLAYTLAAYPNPFSGQLWVSYELSNPFNKASILLTNVLGEVVAELPIHAASGQVSLGDEFTSSGVYFLRIMADGQVGGTVKVVRI